MNAENNESHERALQITTSFLDLRRVLNLTGSQFANLFGMSRQYIFNLQKSTQKAMNPSTIITISYILKRIKQHPNYIHFSERQKNAVEKLFFEIDEYMKHIINPLNFETIMNYYENS